MESHPRNVVIVVLDSCRWDTLVAANPRFVGKLGEIRRRRSCASWTAPSHMSMLMGLMPHENPPGAPSHLFMMSTMPEWSRRVGEKLDYAQFSRTLWLPSFLRGMGWRTAMFSSMPVIGSSTAINRDFDEFVDAKHSNSLRFLLRDIQFDSSRPNFVLINTGETHYPYDVLGDQGVSPYIPGLRGVLGALGGVGIREPLHFSEIGPFMSPENLERLRQKQIRAAGLVDGALEMLFDTVPPNTWITVTADHGELFGEGGYFGHGPVQHDKVFEVPFVEGRIR